MTLSQAPPGSTLAPPAARQAELREHKIPAQRLCVLLVTFSAGGVGLTVPLVRIPELGNKRAQRYSEETWFLWLGWCL